MEHDPVVARVVVVAVRMPVRLPDVDLDVAAKDDPVVPLDDRVGEIGAERATWLSAVNDPVCVAVAAHHLGALEACVPPCGVQDRLGADRPLCSPVPPAGISDNRERPCPGSRPVVPQWGFTALFDYQRKIFINRGRPIRYRCIDHVLRTLLTVALN